MELILQTGGCSVEELAQACGVSDMTIRRDLAKLAENGQVLRTHGGASPGNQVSFEFQFLRRSQENAGAKQLIGATAATLINDGQSVLLDSGSTTLAIARELTYRHRLTIITTSLPIASVLQRAPRVETLLLGGYVRRESPDLEGPLTEANLDYLRADIGFIGTDGIDGDGNVYNASLSLARMLSKMVTSAERVYVVADQTKLGRKALASYGNVKQWAGLITDAPADSDIVRQLQSAGVKLIFAGDSPPKKNREAIQAPIETTMSEFKYAPSQHVPFRDLEAIARCRSIKREDIDKHPNPDFKIRVVKDVDPPFMMATDMLARIMSARDEGKTSVMILPNPVPLYRHVARLINRLQIDCKHVHLFAMDEYANEKGEIAPDTWRLGFGYAMKHNFLYQIEEKLRMPEKQAHVFTNANLKDYGKMITDMGGADICYSGPGWTGHVAFVEPDAPEFDAPLDEWLKMGPRICTLSPFTLAQNSMHGSFGMSGDLAAVPPKAATIGPAQVVEAKNRIDTHALSVHGTTTSWQRLMTRLCLHGPVTPKLPTSMHQLLRTDVVVSETAAMNIEPNWDKGY